MTIVNCLRSNIHGAASTSTTAGILFCPLKYGVNHSRSSCSNAMTTKIVKRTSVLASSFRFSSSSTSKRAATTILSHKGHEITISNIPIHEKSNHTNTTVESFFSTTTTPGQDSEFLSPQSQALLKEIRARAENETDFLISTRRTLHQHPELMYQEETTSLIVETLLQQMNIFSYTKGWAKNLNPTVHAGPGGFGLVADIGTGHAPCVLLRADMDALPIFERTQGIDNFKSRYDNCMHACGHDAHTTMLLGAASILKQFESSIPGTVRLMFQPAEEGGAGAKRMREEGLLQTYPPPQHAFGMHVWPTLPSGTIASRPGPILAAAERFEIVLAGVGGHAAMPHLTTDSVVTASAIVMNLQSIISRNTSPLEYGVVTVTVLNAGEALNIIPASATLKGTFRALSTKTLLSLRDRLEHVVHSTAKTYGCTATIKYSPDFYPPTINDPVLFEDFSNPVAALVAQDGTVHDTGAEDFSFLAETIPSTFFLLGQGSGTSPPTNFGLHHPHFALDEAVMPKGVELHVNLALRALKRLQQQASSSEPV
jgi:amidohydrolase